MRTDGRTVGQRDMKLTVAFRSFSKAPKTHAHAHTHSETQWNIKSYTRNIIRAK